jgi:alpha-ketoglutaric semialdehyde dehydrogenase
LTISGNNLIGGKQVQGGGPIFHAYSAATGEMIDPGFASATMPDLREACRLAALSTRPYRVMSLSKRAQFLETIAKYIEAVGDELIERAMLETGLPRPRLEGERARTVGQLRMFAEVVRNGSFLDARVDTEIPNRTPARRPDIREQHIALGPVAVFGASNFPLAFSVAGGDTASALAAGCPVIVKAHSAHPGTSALVGNAIRAAASDLELPEGVFSLLFDSGFGIGNALVAAPEIKAAAFTGSRRGGMALLKIARERSEPIPLYAEMSSINPVVLLAGALQERAESIASGFVAALTLGVGQFCTNPGLVLAINSPGLDVFTTAAGTLLTGVASGPMLTAGIRSAFNDGVSRLSEHTAVKRICKGSNSQAPAALFSTTASAFRDYPELSEEVFGPSSLVVRCNDEDDLRSVLERLEGQLTAAIHMTDADQNLAASLVPILEEKAGRILVNGYGTGVEVSHAMVHGGPFPATSDSRATSVGSLAIRRFLRPVAYQDFPAALLPDSLKDTNPFSVPRLVDGKSK